MKPVNGHPDSSYSNVAHVVTTLVYCTPFSASNSCNVFGNYGPSIDDILIFNATDTLLENIATGCNTAGFSDYTGMLTANLEVNEIYNYKIILSNDNGAYVPQTLSIWMDLNQDGDFEDVDENLVSDIDPPGYVVNGTFDILANTLAGITTMRVRGRFRDGNSVAPCGEIVFSEAEDYRVVILNPDCPPVAMAGADKEICDGGATTLISTGSSTGADIAYLWSPSTGLNDPTSPYPLASPNVTTQYTLTVTNTTSGCTATDSIIITVLPLPNIMLNAIGPLCSSSEPYDLTLAEDPSYPDGIWSGPGVAGDLFYPVGLIGQITLNYYYFDGTCSTNANLTVEIVMDEINWVGSAGLWSTPTEWDLGQSPLPCNEVEITTGETTLTSGNTGWGKTLEVGLGALLDIQLGATLIIEQ